MNRFLAAAFVVAVSAGALVYAQEPKKVPKDSVRVAVPGCVKGYVFTAGRPPEDTHGAASVPEGTHLRMAGPKKLMSELTAQEGSRVEITGLIRKGQMPGDGVSIGGGGRISGGGPPVAGVGGFGSIPRGPDRIVIDVEGWRPIPGDCPGR